MKENKLKTLAKSGHKFIILFTLPSGAKFSAGEKEGKLMLIPLSENGVLRDVIAWSYKEDVFEWLKNMQRLNGKEKFDRWMKLSPEIGQVRIAQ